MEKHSNGTVRKTFFKKVTRIGAQINLITSHLRGESFPSLITVTISKKAILHNLEVFTTILKESGCETRVAPVLKSNAYGHGLALIARILTENTDTKKNASQEQIPFLVIDSYFEARVLRDEGIKTPLLVLGYTSAETILSNSYNDVRFTVTGLENLKSLARLQNASLPNPRFQKTKLRRSARTPLIHLKINTGMHRQGIDLSDIKDAIAVIKNTPITLEGICTHFADADNTDDDTFTDKQIGHWNSTVTLFKKEFPSLSYWHASNTAGHGHRTKINANVSRLGIGLYGFGEEWIGRKKNTSMPKLMPALEMNTIISGTRHIAKGSLVGYSCTFAAPHDMTIATIPVGYFEGIDRRLSNKGFVKIVTASGRAFFSPLVGRVSMNISVIDITAIIKAGEKIAEGYQVNVISSDTKDKNCVEMMAQLSSTIPYEILIHIPAHLKRVVAS